MSEILSQAEIDKLMRELSSGEAGEENDEEKDAVRGYDFKTANRYTKEHIRAINIVFKHFGHLLSNYLMGTLRASCDAEVISIEEIPFNEFNNSVPTPVIIAIANSIPFNGAIILQMSKEISFSIIARVLGGTKELIAEGRQFTEIELAIMERVLWQILKSMDEAWSRMMEVNSILDRVETSMQFAQIVDMNEPVLMVTLNITIGKESGIVGFCLPHQALEPFTKRLNTKMIFSGNKGNKIVTNPANMINSIIRTGITVSSEFNPTVATVSDIMDLRVGDVIQLQHRIEDPLIIKYQHLPRFRASLGKYKNKVALKIIDVIKGDEDNE